MGRKKLCNDYSKVLLLGIRLQGRDIFPSLLEGATLTAHMWSTRISNAQRSKVTELD